MKIVQVLHGFPPQNIAGSENYTYNLSRELAKRHDVHVFYRVEDLAQEEYETRSGTYHGLNIHTINNTFKHCTSFEQTYKNAAIAQRFGRWLDTVEPQVVHFAHLNGLSTTLIEAASKRGIPIVFTLHDFWLFCQLGQLLKRDLSLCHGPEDSECAKCLAPQRVASAPLRKVFDLVRRVVPDFNKKTRLRNTLRAIYHQYAKLVSPFQKDGVADLRARRTHIEAMCALVDLFIAPSQFLRQKFIDFGVPAPKIVHCDLGFDMSLFRGVEKQHSRKLRFGYTGVFIPSKGVHILLQAFSRIDGEEAELRLHGRFEQYHFGFEYYPEYLKSLGKGTNVVWCGEYENRKIGSILAEIDVLIVPSIWYENSPLTIQEAFLAGVPVIASDLGGMAELVQHEVNGLLFRAGDPEALAHQMQAVLADRGIITQLQRNITTGTPMPRHVQQIEQIYDRAIEMANGRMRVAG